MRALVKERTAIDRIAHVDDATNAIDRERGDRLAETILGQSELDLLSRRIRLGALESPEDRATEECALLEICRDLTAEPRVARNDIDARRSLRDQRQLC
jgi:hypothetical protein